MAGDSDGEDAAAAAAGVRTAGSVALATRWSTAAATTRSSSTCGTMWLATMRSKASSSSAKAAVGMAWVEHTRPCEIRRLGRGVHWMLLSAV